MKKLAIKIDENQEAVVWGFVSWKRLAERILSRGGELKNNERIAEFQVDESGIHLGITYKE